MPFSKKDTEVAIALGETLTGFMAQHDVDAQTLRAMLLGTLAGGAIQGGDSLETFRAEAGTMYRATKRLIDEMGTD